MECEVCGKTAKSENVHPCRFEKACTCWYGKPCKAGETLRQGLKRS